MIHKVLFPLLKVIGGVVLAEFSTYKNLCRKLDYYKVNVFSLAEFTKCFPYDMNSIFAQDSMIYAKCSYIKIF